MKIETMFDAMEKAQAGMDAADEQGRKYGKRSLISWALLQNRLAVGIIRRYIRLQQENARLRVELEQAKGIASEARLNFQLEKMDDYIRLLAKALDR